jgi:hypothetical protein
VWVRKRNDFLQAFTEWLSPGLAEEEIRRIDEHLDAVLTFAISIVREVLLRRYSFSKHDSDVYDFLQLHYLALDRFVFVTGDERLRNRLSLSTQGSRLLNFQAYLKMSAE